MTLKLLIHGTLPIHGPAPPCQPSLIQWPYNKIILGGPIWELEALSRKELPQESYSGVCLEGGSEVVASCPLAGWFTLRHLHSGCSRLA